MYSKMPTEFFFQALDGQLYRYTQVYRGGLDLAIFSSTRRTPEQPHKQVKLGTLEYSGINQAIQNISAHAGSDPPSFLD